MTELPGREADVRQLLESARHPMALPVPRYVPTQVVFGRGAAHALDAVIRRRLAARQFHRPLVLTGRESAAKPWLAAVIAACRRLGTAVVVENSRANPTPQSMQHILDLARRHHVDGVVAVGGGSVLDTGKAVALLAAGERSVAEAMDQKPGPTAHRLGGPRGTGLVAVPTTAGSGAEATRTATVWDEHEQRKRALDHEGLFPDLAVVDPLLTISAPDRVWRSCGLDALAQAVESSWAVAADAESLRFSVPAVRLAVEGLEAVLADPGDEAARTVLSCASVFAGLAIAGTRTTVPHAVSYPMTLRYGIPHGHACALTLGAVLRFNAAVTSQDCRDPRGPEHIASVLRSVCHQLDARDPAAAHQRLDALLRRLGLPTLRGLDHIDVRALAGDVVTYNRFDNNPRHMSRGQLTALLHAESSR
ncbi:phosphonoacetaldehyde reductase [Streptomyces chrestomyceticus]|uniref:phosphonoacetaldehyde reductase n=1 Tax=Streptomyces chrestomyceticus TaxID=68185 RepID=UPI0019D30431|nr:phosphonoacetaldehyde reductase [Streptomyces chrestomyceticus]